MRIGLEFGRGPHEWNGDGLTDNFGESSLCSGSHGRKSPGRHSSHADTAKGTIESIVEKCAASDKSDWTYATKSTTAESFLKIIANGFRTFRIAIVIGIGVVAVVVVLLIGDLFRLVDWRRLVAVLPLNSIVRSRWILLIRFVHCWPMVVVVSMHCLNRRLFAHLLCAMCACALCTFLLVHVHHTN